MYAVIQIPVFPLQALLRRMRARPDGPLAVLDESGGRSRVVAADKRARRCEVAEGMRAAQALARCGDLRLLPREPEAEAEAERLLCLLAATLAPRVERTAEGLATVDLRGTGRTGQAERAERLVERFRRCGLHVRIGIADTPDHALWAAWLAEPVKEVRSVERFLRRLPVASAGAPEEIVGILEGWGVRDLAGLRRLPREEVGARLGRRGLDLWDAVAGRRQRLLEEYRPEPKFERTGDLEHRIETLEPLLFVLRRWIEELAVELELAEAAAFVLELDFRLDDRSRERKTVEVPEPSGRAGTLFRILSTALENFQTRSAIVGLGLKLRTTEARARQGDLFAVAMEDAVGFAETADRVAAIVGPARSGSPRLNDSWRPDSFRMENLDTDIRPETEEGGGAARTGLPIRRLRPPRAVGVWLVDGKPAVLRGPVYKGEVLAAAGPWRASGEWWDREAWVREEWDVELAGGGLYRIFREPGGWFVEGLYG